MANYTDLISFLEHLLNNSSKEIMNQISKGASNKGNRLLAGLETCVWQAAKDHTFQILKDFIFTIGWLTFLQATSVSNKFAITLQSYFCSFSTFLILAQAIPKKLQGILRPKCWSFLEKLPHGL